MKMTVRAFSKQAINQVVSAGIFIRVINAVG